MYSHPGPPKPRCSTSTREILAVWMLSAAERGLGGAFNASGRPGATTVGELLQTIAEVVGSDAQLIWAEPDILEAEGLLLGMELGLRFPGNPHPTGMHDVDTSAIHAAGLVCRPLRETLADTWAWLQAEGDPQPPPETPPLDSWLDPAHERRVLDRLTGW